MEQIKKNLKMNIIDILTDSKGYNIHLKKKKVCTGNSSSGEKNKTRSFISAIHDKLKEEKRHT